MKNIFYSLAFIFALAARLFAGGDLPAPNYAAPTVPADVVAQGRQYITSYLVSQVNDVTIEYRGKSVLNQGSNNYLYLGPDDLRMRGYSDAGSFSQLRGAVSGMSRRMKISQLPGGGYDATAAISFRSSDYKNVLEGSSYFEYSRDPDGVLVGRATTYVSIPSALNVPVTGYVWDAKWIPAFGPSIQLSTFYSEDDQRSYVTIPVEKIDSGIIAFGDSMGNVNVIDFARNAVLAGTDAILRIGEIKGGSDIATYIPSGDKFALSHFCGELASFYRSDGKTYGRYPVIDINTSTRIDEVLDFGIRVWGAPSGTYVLPKNIQVRVIRTLDGSISRGVYQPVLMKGGGWLIQLPPGAYQIYTEFEELLDWNQDPNPKG